MHLTSFTVSSLLTLGAVNNSLGIYHLNNGVLTSPNVKVGNGNSTEQSIGSMTIGGGASANLGLFQLITGDVTQTNGVVTTNSLLVSSQFGNDFYDLQGGTLISSSSLVRDNASISYSGGEVIASPALGAPVPEPGLALATPLVALATLRRSRHRRIVI